MGKNSVTIFMPKRLTRRKMQLLLKVTPMRHRTVPAHAPNAYPAQTSKTSPGRKGKKICSMKMPTMIIWPKNPLSATWVRKYSGS